MADKLEREVFGQTKEGETVHRVAISGGGLTPVVAQALAQRGGLTLVGLYLAGAGLLSLAALLVLNVRERARPVPL